MGKLKKLKDALDTAKKIRVYHGSPYKFDKFDASKIGTGEGAQVYGRGIYFAENKGVAESYRNMAHPAIGNDPRDEVTGLIQNWQAVQGRRQLNNEEVKYLMSDFPQLNKLKDNDQIVEYIKRYANGKEYGDIVSADSMYAVKALDKLLPPKPKGSLYTAEIPEADYLLWDKPLNQQPESIKSKLVAGVIKETEPSDSKWLATINGEVVNGFQTKKAAQAWLDNEAAGKIYESLELTKSKYGAANYLKENGIPGIKYLDGSSRSAGEGSYNYVVFDDNEINILERGKIDPRLLAPLAAGSGATVAAQMAYDDEKGDFSKATRAYQDFMERRQQKKPVWDRLRQGGEALRTIAQGMGAGIVSDAYRLGGYLSPQPVQDTDAQAQTIMNRLAYVPQDQNPIIEEMGQQLDQFGQDVRPLVNAFQKTPIYKAYEMLPERAQGVFNVLSNYAF